jgi:hypothetical protein
MSTRNIAICCGASSLKGLENRSDVEVYFVDGPDIEHQVDMALLNDLITPCKLAFVGGDLAKRLATAYYGTWIEDTPSVNEDLLAFWGCC